MPTPVNPATSAASMAPSPPGVGAAAAMMEAPRYTAPTCAKLDRTLERHDRSGERRDVSERDPSRSAQQGRQLHRRLRQLGDRRERPLHEVDDMGLEQPPALARRERDAGQGQNHRDDDQQLAARRDLERLRRALLGPGEEHDEQSDVDDGTDDGVEPVPVTASAGSTPAFCRKRTFSAMPPTFAGVTRLTKLDANCASTVVDERHAFGGQIRRRRSPRRGRSGATAATPPRPTPSSPNGWP